jgi:hypothetical protein
LKLSLVELLALFGRDREAARAISAADAAEYLALVTYLAGAHR